MPIKTFSQRVVECALSVPPGRVTTYGLITRAAGGGAMGARSVTSILSKAFNAGEKNIPFHRIVYSNGTIWTSPKYNALRKNLYKKEDILLDNKNRITNFRDILYEFC
jgi:alkylated DNA nucleotide flippase Atl1